MKILVVDDHPLYRAGVVHTLHATVPDVEVTECGSVGAALERLDAGLEVQLMILDLQMPGFQGTDSVRTVRARRPDVPVLVLSASLAIYCRELEERRRPGRHGPVRCLGGVPRGG